MNNHIGVSPGYGEFRINTKRAIRSVYGESDEKNITLYSVTRGIGDSELTFSSKENKEEQPKREDLAMSRDLLWTKLLEENNNNLDETKKEFKKFEGFKDQIAAKFSNSKQDNQSAVYSYHQNYDKRQKNTENTATVKSFVKELKQIEQKEGYDPGQ